MSDRLIAAAALLAGALIAFIGADVPKVEAYAPPFSAFLLLAAFLLAFPGFLGPRLRYPHAVILPVVFLTFTLAVGTFWDIRGGALMVVANMQLAAAQYFIDPLWLGRVFLWQTLLLGLAPWRRSAQRT